MSKYSGQGWHFQTTRHSNARKYGRAGGKYASMSIPELRGKMDTNNHLAYMNQSINKEFALKKLHENQEIALEIQKRIDKAQWDEIVRRDEMKTELANKEQEDYAKALKLYKKIGAKKHYGKTKEVNFKREGLTWYNHNSGSPVEEIYVDHYAPSKGWRAVFVTKYQWDNQETYFPTKQKAITYVEKYAKQEFIKR
jgi:hypothetical protein